MLLKLPGACWNQANSIMRNSKTLWSNALSIIIQRSAAWSTASSKDSIVLWQCSNGANSVIADRMAGRKEIRRDQERKWMIYYEHAKTNFKIAGREDPVDDHLHINKAYTPNCSLGVIFTDISPTNWNIPAIATENYILPCLSRRESAEKRWK